MVRHGAAGGSTSDASQPLTELANFRGAELAGQECEAVRLHDTFDQELAGVKGLLSAGAVGWLSDLERNFGYRLLVLLFFAEHVLKGGGGCIAWRAAPYLFKAYNVPAQEVQILSSVTGLPWVLKPIIGLVSDLCPIGGYNKAPYALLSCVFGIAGCLAVGLLPPDWLSVGQVALCLFFVQMQISTTDLMAEAAYSERLQSDPKHGPDLLAFVFIGLQAWGLLALLAFGMVLADFGVRPTYLLLAGLCCGVVAPVALGYFQEPCRSAAETAEVRAHFWQQREICALPFIMLAGTAAISVCVALSRDPEANALTAVAVAMAVLLSTSLVLSPTIARFAAFTLIQTALSLSVAGPAFYFMTDTPEQYAEGPHFSEVFYNMVLGTVSGVFSLIGMLSYNRFSRSFTYRGVLVTVNLALSTLHLLDIVLFTRMNLKLGIPDRALVLGATSLGMAVNQWQWMPQMALFSLLCPKGMEATMFALIVGCHNLGVGVANSLGAVILKWLSVNPRGLPGDAAELENLWMASLVASVLPMLSVMLLFCLIPDVRIGEKPLAEHCTDATTGSLWRRLSQADS